jgi:hypothetical protein
MNDSLQSRRRFLKTAAVTTGAVLFSPRPEFGQALSSISDSDATESSSADYTLRIKVSPVEVAPNRIISTTTYNAQFPGPLNLSKTPPTIREPFEDPRSVRPSADKRGKCSPFLASFLPELSLHSASRSHRQ